MLKASHKIEFDAVPRLHLFDILITPILNKNCEVLSQISKHKIVAINNNKYGLEKLYLDTPGEKLHLQFCRNILGVSNKTSVVATLGELGSYPLMIKSFSQMIKYWHHIKAEVDSNSLVYKILSFMENKERLGQHNWMSTIKFILCYCGMEDVWLNPNIIKNGSLATKCNIILRDKFVEYWSALLHSQQSSALSDNKNTNTHGNNKLRTYRLIKSDYRIENYLIHVNSRDERKMLAKLRCSNHSLSIETGRHCNVELLDRKCSRCDYGPLHDLTRNKFYRDYNVECAESKTTFVQLFTSREPELLKHLARFINACSKTRSHAIQCQGVHL